ncbi:MAG: porin family protein [Ferruginibacter sp.]
MKKKILLILFVVISSHGFSQSKISYGFRAGVSTADMRGDAVESLNGLLDFADGYLSTGRRTGFFTGTYVDLPLGNVLTVEPGFNYTQKGYQLKGSLKVKGVDILGVNAKAQLQMNYIEIPLLLKANIGGFNLFAGPQLSYLVNADLRASAGALGFNILSTKIPATSQFNHWDAGITGGVGYQFSNGINLMASYDHGLSKVDAGKNFTAYNRAVKIGLGYNF